MVLLNWEQRRWLSQNRIQWLPSGSALVAVAGSPTVRRSTSVLARRADEHGERGLLLGDGRTLPSKPNYSKASPVERKVVRRERRRSLRSRSSSAEWERAFEGRSQPCGSAVGINGRPASCDWDTDDCPASICECTCDVECRARSS